MKPFASRLSLILALLCVTSLASAEQYYKWTDAQGVVHYTRTPPPESAAGSTALKVNSVPPSTAPAPASTSSQVTPEVAAATGAAATSTAQSKAEAEAEKEYRQQLCAQARQELAYSTTNGGRRVMEVRGDEKRIALPAERKLEADKWRAEIAKNCN